MDGGLKKVYYLMSQETTFVIDTLAQCKMTIDKELLVLQRLL